MPNKTALAGRFYLRLTARSAIVGFRDQIPVLKRAAFMRAGPHADRRPSLIPSTLKCSRPACTLGKLLSWPVRHIGPGIILVGSSSIGNSALLHFTFGLVGLNMPFGLSLNSQA